MTGNRPVVNIDVDALRPSDAYSPFAWTANNLVRLVALALFGAILFDVYPSRSEGNAAESFLAWFWGSMLMLTVAIALFGIPYVRMHLFFRRTPSFKNPKRYSFSPEGMHFASESVIADYKWTAFQRIGETRDAFLIMQTSRSATIIPKRFFSSLSEVQMLRELVAVNFKGKWRLRRD